MRGKAAETAVDIPEPTLIGYFARPAMARPDWLKAPQVEEICCFPACMIKFDWINEWRHNAEWVFNTPELAWSVVPEPLHAECQTFGFRLFPVRYRLGRSEKYPLPAQSDADVMGLAPKPLDSRFERLGYDLVPRSCENAFECSPLCCNHLAESVPINRYCLLDTAEEAFALAPTLEVPGQPMRGEPGPYHIVEVWRQRRA